MLQFFGEIFPQSNERWIGAYLFVGPDGTSALELKCPTKGAGQSRFRVSMRKDGCVAECYDKDGKPAFSKGSP